MERMILHSDINACYASIELLRHPELRGRPVAVGGEQELRHGIILAKDQMARAAGVRTGMTLWAARQQCPELTILPPDFDLYYDYSRRVRQVYADFTDRCEPFGMDECWLDMTGCVGREDALQTAQAVRQRVLDATGLTVSVGVSWCKVIAKLGSDYRKPNAVTVIDRARFADMVWPLPVGSLLFAGRSSVRQLERLGIRTVGALAAADADMLRQRFGKSGVQLHAYANGYDPAPVHRVEDLPPPKSISNSATAPRDHDLRGGCARGAAVAFRERGCASAAGGVSVPHGGAERAHGRPALVQSSHGAAPSDGSDERGAGCCAGAVRAGAPVARAAAQHRRARAGSPACVCAASDGPVRGRGAPRARAPA